MKPSNFGHSSDLQLLSEQEAAALLGLSPSTLRDWRWKRRGPAYSRFGRAIRYGAADLAEWIAAARTAPDANINGEVL